MNEESAILNPSLGWWLAIILGIFWVLLGQYWGKKAKSFEGFALAGRNVGLALGAATAVATWITSNTTLLAPQFALQMGAIGMLAYSTASIGLFFFAPMASRIKHLMPRGYTSGDFIRLRYGKWPWGVFLAISVFYAFTWLVSMAMAGGILMQALSGIPYLYGMSIILLVCVLYTLFGGLFAVIGTDFIQSVIIIIGVFIVGISVLNHTDFSVIYTNISKNNPQLLNLLLPVSIMAIFNNLLFGMGEIFHSNVWWSRAFAMRKDVAKKAYLLSGLFWLPIPIVAGFIALAAPALGFNVPSPDMVGPLVAAKVLGVFGAIAIFIVVFCSLASSIDSLLAATSDLIVVDFYKRMINRNASEEKLRSVSAKIIIALGILAWAVSAPRIGTLATVLFFAGPMVGSAIWPIITGLYWKKANKEGAILAMILGSTFGLWAYFTIGWYTATLIATTVSMIIVILSVLIKPSSFNWKDLDESMEENRKGVTS